MLLPWESHRTGLALASVWHQVTSCAEHLPPCMSPLNPCGALPVGVAKGPSAACCTVDMELWHSQVLSDMQPILLGPFWVCLWSFLLCFQLSSKALVLCPVWCMSSPVGMFITCCGHVHHLLWVCVSSAVCVCVVCCA